jgi:hypothetical protein
MAMYRRRRLADALVDRTVGTLVGSGPETYTWMLGRHRLEDGCGRVARAVVDAVDLAHRLGEHAVDRGSDETLVVVDRDHDGDIGRRPIGRVSRSSEAHRRPRLACLPSIRKAAAVSAGSVPRVRASPLPVFDQATERQRERQRGQKRHRPGTDRGWRRDDLYERGRAR